MHVFAPPPPARLLYLYHGICINWEISLFLFSLFRFPTLGVTAFCAYFCLRCNYLLTVTWRQALNIDFLFSLHYSFFLVILTITTLARRYAPSLGRPTTTHSPGAAWLKNTYNSNCTLICEHQYTQTSDTHICICTCKVHIKGHSFCCYCFCAQLCNTI